MKIPSFKFQVINKFDSILRSSRQVGCIMNHIIDQDQSMTFIDLQFPNLLSKFDSLNA